VLDVGKICLHIPY